MHFFEHIFEDEESLEKDTGEEVQHRKPNGFEVFLILCIASLFIGHLLDSKGEFFDLLILLSECHEILLKIIWQGRLKF